MKVTLLDDSNEFPPISSADKSGIVAVGGDLSAARLLSAYENGIFPWFNPGEMIMWWSPEERGIIPLEGLKVHKSMRNEINRMRYTVTYDTCFKDVITQCSKSFRGEETQAETWIDESMINAYLELHKLGVAHSVEVWKGAELVGGLYGVSIGRMFFGESMFSKATNASKIGLFNLVEKLMSWGFGPIDCQMMNPHLESLGAIPISRTEFQDILDKHLNSGKTILGTWTE